MATQQITPDAGIVDRTTWGDRLRRIRLNRHLDQGHFAALLGGIKKPTVGKYELAGDPPRNHELIEAAVELKFGKEAADYLRGQIQPSDYKSWFVFPEAV